MTTARRARAFAAPCPSCGAKAGDSCVTASGYVTMRHKKRRSACPTCGPTVTEAHPRRPGVNRCANCKEWL